MRWFLHCYGLSYRDVKELLTNRIIVTLGLKIAMVGRAASVLVGLQRRDGSGFAYKVSP